MQGLCQECNIKRTATASILKNGIKNILESTHQPPNPSITMEPTVDAEGNLLHEADRVYTYHYHKDGKPTRCYGTLYRNEERAAVSEWYILYDDGTENPVLVDTKHVYKA